MAAVRRALALVPVLSLLTLAVAPAAAEGPGGDAKTKAPEPKEARREVIAPKPEASPERLTITLDDGKSAVCREQAAQPFLIRSNWFPRTKDADKIKEGRKLLEQAIRYRTEQYGYFEGFGDKRWNPHPPKHYAKGTTFMGLRVQVHEKIIPALKCVEAALTSSPAGGEYNPSVMGGIRFRNTYRGVEVSNHVYGIAVDIEPTRNTCCGCVKPWNEHPLCKQKDKTVWERMAMPRSWVEAFERFGFYWLGHDVLQDTMHFEFLGDPDKITEPASP